MSEAITSDTHRFVKNLTASGFTEAQAEALADEGTSDTVSGLMSCSTLFDQALIP